MKQHTMLYMFLSLAYDYHIFVAYKLSRVFFIFNTVDTARLCEF